MKRTCLIALFAAVACISFSQQTIYTAGWRYDGKSFSACYWKDGSLFSLPAGGDGSGDSYAHSITVSDDGHVYVAGEYFDGRKLVPCYWVDGKRSDLPGGEPPTGASALAICLQGESVYVLGRRFDGTNQRACYWKDGARFDLDGSPNGVATVASSMCTSGGSVYIAGWTEMTDGDTTPRLWKDGVGTDLPDHNARANSVTPSQSGVTVVSEVYHLEGLARAGEGLAVLLRWRLSGLDARLLSCAEVASGLVVAGWHEDSGMPFPCIWVNGQFSYLSIPDDIPGAATSVAVRNDAIFIGGYYGSPKVVPCYWKDGERVDLPCPDSARVMSIFVK